jgi:hypothetical protein
VSSGILFNHNPVHNVMNKDLDALVMSHGEKYESNTNIDNLLCDHLLEHPWFSFALNKARGKVVLEIGTYCGVLLSKLSEYFGEGTLIVGVDMGMYAISPDNTLGFALYAGGRINERFDSVIPGSSSLIRPNLCKLPVDFLSEDILGYVKGDPTNTFAFYQGSVSDVFVDDARFGLSVSKCMLAYLGLEVFERDVASRSDNVFVVDYSATCPFINDINRDGSIPKTEDIVAVLERNGMSVQVDIGANSQIIYGSRG